jgi:hypothetical protein
MLETGKIRKFRIKLNKKSERSLKDGYLHQVGAKNTQLAGVKIKTSSSEMVMKKIFMHFFILLDL